MSDDEDVPSLPADTLAILQQFLTEREERNELLNSSIENDKLKENRLFDEDWQLSQFWYDDETIDTICKIVVNNIDANGSVCLISCPTLFAPIKKIVDKNLTVTLLEYDQRFAVYGSDFIFYDFNDPLNLPKELAKSFDLVIADPPFLSEECLKKTTETIKMVAKEKIMLCTGTIMNDLATKLLDVNMSTFKPKHKNNLANEFSCFSNFDFVC